MTHAVTPERRARSSSICSFGARKSRWLHVLGFHASVSNVCRPCSLRALISCCWGKASCNHGDPAGTISLTAAPGRQSQHSRAHFKHIPTLKRPPKRPGACIHDAIYGWEWMRGGRHDVERGISTAPASISPGLGVHSWVRLCSLGSALVAPFRRQMPSSSLAMNISKSSPAQIAAVPFAPNVTRCRDQTVVGRAPSAQ